MQTAALGTSTRQNLTIAALGVVYGDIGTSPLYAVKLCFHDPAAITMPRVFGVLSLIVWALTIIVTIKYVIMLMRADNRGEGGIFALTNLALRSTAGRRNRWVLFAGLIGGSLFFGDGILTPSTRCLARLKAWRSKPPNYDLTYCL